MTFADAIVELEKVQAADRNNRQVHTLLADSYVHTGENKKAIDLLWPVYTTSSNDAAVDYVLGTALARDGQAELAQRVINPLMEGPDSAEKHMLLGTAKFAARDYPGALEELRKAAEMNPNLPEVNSYYGQALFSNGHTEESKAPFEKELARNPNDFQSNVHIGLLLKQDQNYDDALKFLKRALASRPRRRGGSLSDRAGKDGSGQRPGGASTSWSRSFPSLPSSWKPMSLFPPCTIG